MRKRIGQIFSLFVFIIASCSKQNSNFSFSSSNIDSQSSYISNSDHSSISDISFYDSSSSLPSSDISINSSLSNSSENVEIKKCTISFDANGGSGEIAPIILDENTSFTLPENTFVAPEGKEFAGWLTNSAQYHEGDSIIITSDTIIIATWKKILTPSDLNPEIDPEPEQEEYFDYDANDEYFTSYRLKKNEDEKSWTLVNIYTFAKELTIPSYIQDLPITIIGNGETSIFKDSEATTYLNKVSFPDTVNAIANNGLRGSGAIKEYVFSSSIKTIGDSAFNSNNLHNVILPEGLLTIGDSAFGSSYELTEIDIPSTVKEIGESCFANCRCLEKINVPANNDYYASLDGVLFDKKLTILICLPSKNIEYEKDKRYVVPDGVEVIKKFAFYEINEICGVDFPDTLTCIEERAFYECLGLTSIVFPASIKTIGKWAFRDCYNLVDIKVASDNPYFSCLNGALYNKDKTILYNYFLYRNDSFTAADTVIEISEYAFYKAIYLEEVNLPTTVEKIGEYAFRECRQLKKISPLTNLKHLGRGAFYSCMSLKEIELSNSLSTIEEETFYWCTRLINFHIPDSLVEIKPYAFSSNYCLENITFGKNLKIIGDYAFSGCHKLISVTFSDGLISIGDYAFSNCVKLDKVILPDSLKMVGDYAFAKDTHPYLSFQQVNYSEIYIGENVLSLGACAFGAKQWKETKLTISNKNRNFIIKNHYLFNIEEQSLQFLLPTFEGELIIDKSVRKIEPYAFAYCESLTAVHISSATFSIGEGAFLWCQNLKRVDLSKEISVVEPRLFEGCTSLEYIDLSQNNLKSIGHEAFASCLSIKQLVLPATIKKIGAAAFLHCESLEKIDLPEELVSIDDTAFSCCYSLKEINISENVSKIEISAFYKTQLLEKITINSENKHFYTHGNAIYTKAEKKTLLYAPTNIEELIVDEGTYCIGEMAFSESDIARIIIPNTVKVIGEQAFHDCFNLASIYFPKSVVLVYPFAFDRYWNSIEPMPHIDIYFANNQEDMILMTNWNKGKDNDGYTKLTSSASFYFGVENNNL